LAPHLADGPGGKGWLVGDLHLENFGAYRPEGFANDAQRHKVVFAVNDFDDAFIGPQRLDVLRLLTSTLLAARDWGLSTPAMREAGEVVLSGVVLGRAQGKAGRPPKAVRDLLSKATARTRRELLDERTRPTRKGRRFLLGPRYRSLGFRGQRLARAAFARYIRQVPLDLRGQAESWNIEDLAFRVAGTGSLGRARIAVLVAGKGGPHGGWFFEMKEQGTPAGKSFASAAVESGARRVLSALHACLERPPRMAGTTKFGGRPMLVRRLMPQEDTLDLGGLSSGEREGALAYLGALTGALHRRGANHPRAWKTRDARILLENAVTLAGLHEAAAVHYTALIRER
jgi:uncharacterized protein (DUF2252 family)